MIVMNEQYWNEYIKNFVDKKFIIKILKFYQSNVSVIEDVVEELTFDERVGLARANSAIVSDVFTLKVTFGNCPKLKIFNNIAMEIKNFYSNCEAIITLPIISVLNEKYGIPLGSYCFNIEEGSLLLIKEFNESEIEDIAGKKSQELLLTYFLNIEESVFIYGKQSYNEGIMQAGVLKYKIEKLLIHQGYRIEKDFKPFQKLTHIVGINLRKELLISYQFITRGL